MVSEAIASGDVQAINYFVAQKYVDTLAEFAASPNQKVMFLPLEAASVIGAIGGIGEIVRQTFGDDSGPGGNGGRRPPRPRPTTGGGSVPTSGAWSDS